MGTKLKEIIEKKNTSFKELAGKRLVVDSFNILYQFLSSIRQSDGTPLVDSKGNVTSHLSGLFFRTAKMLEHDIKPIFVFDGKAPDIKKKERERRAETKEEAKKEYEIAKQREDIDSMKKFASRTSVLTREMVEEAKELVKAFGLPVVQAPSEGEAQAAFMVNKGHAFAEVSQDYDCLLYGVKRVIHNLTVSEKRKKPGTLSFVKVVPQMVELVEVLQSLEIDQEQMIMIGILIGTDYNIGGVRGIGPKKALKLVKDYKDRYDEMFESVRWADYFDFDWKDIYNVIKNMKVTEDYEIQFKEIDVDKIKEILVEKHGFGEDRIDNALSKLKQKVKEKAQTGLGNWMG